jgi:hypothetical protein
MKFKLLVTALALAMTQMVFAANDPVRPDKCPTVASMRSVGVSDIYKFRDHPDGGVVAMSGFVQNNSFGTDVEWSLLVGLIEPGHAKNEVLALANSLETDLVYSIGPVQERTGQWVCAYTHPTDKEHGDKGYTAWAIYPSMDLPPSLLTSILKK